MPDHLVRWNCCTGTLSRTDGSVAIRCDIVCAHDGELLLTIEDIPLTRDVTWLLIAAHEDNPCFAATLVDENGSTLLAADILLTSVAIPILATGTMIRLKGVIGKLDVQVCDGGAQGDRSVKYHTVGMQCFGVVRGTCEHGDVAVGGLTDITDFHRIAGVVEYRRSRHESALSEWTRACDRHVLAVLRAMSFALGRFIDWSVREVYDGGQLVNSRFVGPRRYSAPAEPAFHFIALQPALDLALRCHKQLTDPSVGIGEAIDWLAPWHSLAEIRFLSAMTAFETLLARSDAAPGTLLDADTYRAVVRPRLAAVIDDRSTRAAILGSHATSEIASDVDAGLREIGAKLGNLNQRSLPTRLGAFLKQHRVPLDDLPHSVEALARGRNRIVHGARSLAAASVTTQADTLREALRRTILAILGFEGQFHTWVPRRQWRPFQLAAVPRA